MLTGFAGVPFFKFAAPMLPVVGVHFEALSELPPAFVCSGIVAVLVSLLDKNGQASMAGIDGELTNQSVTGFSAAPLMHPKPTTVVGFKSFWIACVSDARFSAGVWH